MVTSEMWKGRPQLGLVGSESCDICANRYGLQAQECRPRGRCTDEKGFGWWSNLGGGGRLRRGGGATFQGP